MEYADIPLALGAIFSDPGRGGNADSIREDEGPARLTAARYRDGSIAIIPEASSPPVVSPELDIKLVSVFRMWGKSIVLWTCNDEDDSRTDCSNDGMVLVCSTCCRPTVCLCLILLVCSSLWSLLVDFWCTGLHHLNSMRSSPA